MYLKHNDITVSLGNSKLNKSILIFNLPTVKTCPNNEICKKTCYAQKAERLYKNVLPCRERNYQASKDKLDFYKSMNVIIKIAIIKYGVRYIRVHESGDFYSRGYSDLWEVIARKWFGIKFFAYTKSLWYPQVSNFNIVQSILPDGSLNYGDKKTIIKLAKKYHAKICPYGLTSNKTAYCGLKCKACMTNKYVLFLKH